MGHLLRRLRPGGAFTKVDYEDTVKAVEAARALPFVNRRGASRRRFLVSR
jgi:hypothetical protein